jgi:hypothetical protein
MARIYARVVRASTFTLATNLAREAPGEPLAARTFSGVGVVVGKEIPGIRRDIRTNSQPRED